MSTDFHKFIETAARKHKREKYQCEQQMQSRELLEKLVAYATVSRDSNLALIDFTQQYLQDAGYTPELIYNEEKTKANLYCVIGPAEKPGVMLSGHTDVVPVDGQNWSSDPFIMREQDNKLYGRGTCDMKGFIACVLSAVKSINADKLQTPLHLAFSYDEEIGCIGVRRLLDTLKSAKTKPKFCIVGEPTMMQPVIEHKGKTAARVHCHGVEGHSSLAPKSVNAIYLATDLINEIRSIQQRLIGHGTHDHEYDISHTTLHVGTLKGGTALNIVPNYCTFDFEIRNLPVDNPLDLINELIDAADQIVKPLKAKHPGVKIDIETINEYPALNTTAESDIVAFVRELTGANILGKIAFGTEGGLFKRELEVETIVLGPGNIEQAHKPDEFISIDQLDRCDRFITKLIAALS